MSLGGALAANIHGRGLRFKPIIQDIEAFTLVDASGKIKNCSRSENVELFQLAIGGYGLFGIIAAITLRLMPRVKLERVVELIDLEDLMSSLQNRIKTGFLYGDFQYSTDLESDTFLKKGVFSCYRPVGNATAIVSQQKELSEKEWRDLFLLAHTDRRKTYEFYTNYYLSTNGQIYWSDTHQLSVYIDNYHEQIDQRLGTKKKATEMITEIYVPSSDLSEFMREVREEFRKNKEEIIYGTIRLIEKDDESFLTWAKDNYVCVIFNLHAVHTDGKLQQTQAAFRKLIDFAIKYGGSYFLTYHRWASRKQVETCYPQFKEFLKLKKKYDPEDRFQSEWYRHYVEMFADVQ